MDNVDNRPAAGKEEAAPRCSFAPCAAFALLLGRITRPVLSVQQTRPPRGAASTQQRPEYGQHRPRLFARPRIWTNIDNEGNAAPCGEEEAAPALFFCRVCLFVQQEAESLNTAPPAAYELHRPRYGQI